MSGEPAGSPEPRRALILAVAILATAMVAIDLTIAGVALPHMQGSFSVTQDQIAWVMTSYIAAAAVVLPATGWASARIGRKRLFFWALLGFTAVSILCGAAQSLEEEVAYRTLQGMFSAPLVPLSQAVILDTYPREQHGKALGIWGLGLMLGPIVGPTIGGHLTEEYGWPYIYYINVPIGIVACLGVLWVIPQTPRSRENRLDWFGFATLGLAVATLQLLLDRGERQDWFDSTEILMETAIAGLCFYLFTVHLFTARRSFLDRALLRDRNFAVGLILVFVFGFVLLPPLVLLPPFLQDLRSHTVTDTGILVSIRGFGVMAGMQLGGRMVDRVDARLVMLVGLLGFALGGWPMARWTLEVGRWDIIWTGVVQGMGLGLFYVPLLTVAFSTLPARHRTEGTGFFQLMRNVGSSIGVSLFASLLARNTTVSHAVLVEHVNPYNALLKGPAAVDMWNIANSQGLARLDVEVTRQAAMIAYADDFLLIVLAALAAIPVLLLMRPPRRGAPPPVTPARRLEADS